MCVVRRYAKVITNLNGDEAREVDKLCEVCMEFFKQHALFCCGCNRASVGLLQVRWWALAHKKRTSVGASPTARR